MTDVTRLLDGVQPGDPKAAAELLPLVYEELRKLAASKVAREQPGQTLQPTALVTRHGSVSEASMLNGEIAPSSLPRRPKQCGESSSNGRVGETFLARGGFAERQELSDSQIVISTPTDELLTIHEALDKLAAEDLAAAELVKLRYF